MAENVNSFGGVVGSVAVTTVNSVPPSAGTFVPASVVDQGLVHHPVDGVSVGVVQPGHPTDGVNSGQPVGATLPPPSTNVKKTSFQITSVTVDSSASNDGGDESGDDLDESHTEDSSDVATDVSRHTSESRQGGGNHPVTDENFTRNDIFYNPAPPSSMNIAPVIPTSSQYGLAIVPEGLNNNPASEPPLPAPPVASDPANDKADPDKDIVHNRFKVVKIVSTEPFKKGRWMCMDYFDHTTTTTGTSASHKDTTPQQPQQQPVPQSQTLSNLQQQQTIQQGTEKMPVNVVNVQQGSNVPMTSSPPQPTHAGMNNINILPDSQQQSSVNQPQPATQHVMQTQMQNALQHDQDGSVNQGGLPNGNGTHYHDYHVNHSHNVLNHVPPASSVISSNASDSSAFSTPIPNHNPAMNANEYGYTTSIGQQQQQQYYNNTGVLTGMPSRSVSVAPTSTIPTQQQVTMTSQQQPMSNYEQPPRSMAGQVPIVQNPSQPQTIGQIGPQSSISQNQSVPILPQTMSGTSQMHQAPVQVTQPSHLPAQSLPHGAHAQMTGTASINSAPAPVTPAPQQHTAQSLGHNMLQQNKPAFMNPGQHQQSQQQAPTQFQQPPNSQQQQQMMNAAQQQVMANKQNAAPQGQVNQAASNQQQQPQNYQAGVMMQNMPGMQQQVQQMQMNAASVSQHSVPMQQQPGGQAQAIYTTPGQMMGHTMQMGGQQMGMQQNTQQMMQQPQVMQNQTMMQQQPQMVNQQQHHQQMMGMTQQQQPMVSQPQSNAPQQPIMSQNQMMSQMMQQNTQMSGMVTQTPLVSQPGVIPQQQGIIPPQTNLPQQNMIQQIPQQSSYPSQAQPQTITNQTSMQQPLMQQYPQPQPNPVVQQQQMMPPQSQSNIMAQQMGQQMPQGQQPSQIQIQQQPQQAQPSQQQATPQPQQPPPPQVSIPPQPQQNVYQTPPQQMQVSQANVVQGMAAMQQAHNIMPPSSQSIPQMPTGTIPMQTNSNDAVNANSNLSNTDSSSQPMVQQQQQQPPAVTVPNTTQVQAAPTVVPTSGEVQQNQPTTVSAPTTTSAPTQAITSLSAAATVIIDGVNSLGEAASGGNKESEDGESATGTNTVAIDNKIEQAMDLVKSHLMFAVREEVEVLKEKISELMERITQLEYENTILRANATQETLAQLQKSNQHPAPNVNESHQGFS